MLKINSHDTSERPDVRLYAMALSVEHLGGQVIGSSADCSEKKKLIGHTSILLKLFSTLQMCQAEKEAVVDFFCATVIGVSQ